MTNPYAQTNERNVLTFLCYSSLQPRYVSRAIAQIVIAEKGMIKGKPKYIRTIFCIITFPVYYALLDQGDLSAGAH